MLLSACAIPSLTRPLPPAARPGYWLEELAAPALTLRRAGFEVDIASITGGEPPIDAKSLAEPYTSEDTAAFSADEEFQSKVKNTKSVDEYVASAGDYSAVFLPGGHGTVIDFKGSAGLKAVVEGVHKAGGIISAVCHGQCGLLTAKDEAGEFIVKGKKVKRTNKHAKCTHTHTIHRH